MDRFNCGLVELKFAGTDSEMAFSGYGAVFGNVDSYGDVIQKGAFAATIKEAKASGQWPAMLMQHGGLGVSAEDMNPIGVWTQMSEDDNGLLLEGKFAPTARGQEMYTLMKMQPRPAINGLSIGYIPVKWKNGTPPESPRRTLEEVKLMEISPVTFPANGKARVRNVKGIEVIESLKDAEQFLRDSGMSRTEAVAFVSRVKGLGQRDAGGGMQDLVEALRRRGQALS